MAEDMNNQPVGNSGSEGSGDMEELLRQSPFGVLLEIKGADGENIEAKDIFGNLGGSMGGGEGGPPSGMDTSDLPYGGNPFAGDNFWTIFNGGVNPAEASGGGFGGGMPSGEG
ncbi:hypothetical protein, partial [Rivularia sp. UHCC 0363]|uniref:hypothetical protein n=1 Tax=Rivularia sp. UHCC 0363 TaxID=3110244 RepID=UPI002B3BF05F|nr:hypothetical protein [Rivularia sp. UHCC 0363]